MRWYAFLAKAPKKYIGHNPLGHTFMHLFMLNLLFLVVTGFALYSEGAGRDSWQYALFGWVFTIWPNSQDVHTWHHLAMWGVILFVIIHIYTAVREDIVSRQSMISSIISGERVFRDEADK
jgi:Ni/Fe-hydrogenase 1 B-type cytochrome subunit